LNNVHLELPENVKGDDYIVSDIHGMVGLLESELQDVNFNYENDRCISVGDLIDRGPDSKRMLDIAKEPWFYAVYGNHEELFVKAYEEDLSYGGHSDAAPYSLNTREDSMVMWTMNGGGWTYGLDDKAVRSYVNQCKALPRFITLHHRGGKIGICHAQPPTDDWNDVYNHDIITDREMHDSLWGRDLAYHKGMQTLHWVHNIEITVHGHTPMTDLCINQVGNSFFIDTGAFASLPKFGGRGKLMMAKVDYLLKECYS